MTPEAQRIAIAEACGWKPHGYRYELDWHNGWINGTTVVDVLPHYLTDLNAMHEALAQAMFDRSQMQAFLVHLKNQVGPTLESTETLLFWVMMNATAAQRAEAFLRTLGKWEDA